QRLVARDLTPQSLVLPTQTDRLVGGIGLTPFGPRLARRQETVQSPRLDLVVARQRQAENLRRFARRAGAGQDLEDRRRHPLGLGAAADVEVSAAGNLGTTRSTRPGLAQRAVRGR